MSQARKENLFANIILGGEKETPEQQAANKAKKVACKEANRRLAQNAPLNRLIFAIVDSAKAEIYNEKIKTGKLHEEDLDRASLFNFAKGISDAAAMAQNIAPWAAMAQVVVDRWETIPLNKRSHVRLVAGLRRLMRKNFPASVPHVSAVIYALYERGHISASTVAGWVKYRNII